MLGRLGSPEWCGARGGAAEVAEGAAAAAGRAGQRPGVAVPGRIRTNLLAMKSAHEPVVVGLAGMVEERPGTGLAGMDPAEICINMQNNTRNMQLFVRNMQLYVRNMKKICTIYRLY